MRRSCLLLLGIFFLISNACANTVLTWQRVPLNIVLPVGKERLMSFPDAFKFGLSADLEHVVRVQNNYKTLYLLAKKPFLAHRVQVNLNNGLIMLINLSAQIKAPSGSVDVVLPDSFKHSSGNPKKLSRKVLNEAILARFAIHQLYAPNSLLGNDDLFHRYPMESHHMIPLFMNKAALAMPLASWETQGDFITAVQVKNLEKHFLTIQPNMLCGQWQAVAFYPRQVLFPYKELHGYDTTTLFLISTRNFSKALQVCLIGGK
jgi:integrating conjugative element protein (TIGR03749 family)